MCQASCNGTCRCKSCADHQDGGSMITPLWTLEEREQISTTARMMGMTSNEFIHKAVEDALELATFTPANVRLLPEGRH